MSSILTNVGAMIALQTLNQTNRNLETVQSQISTGKRVGSARDNASIWAIAATMTSDVDGFKGISDSLATASASIAVARNAAETVTDLLTQMKSKIVAAQSSTADRAKLQTDVAELRNQINSVVSAAQFNGLNLVDGSSGNIDVLASLDRDASQTVTASTITVNEQNLSAAAGAVRAGLVGSTGVTANGDDATFFLDAGFTADGSNILVFDSAAMAAGDQISVSIGSLRATYTVTAADLATTTPNDTIALGVRSAILGLGIAGLVVDYDSGTPATLDFGNDGAGNADQVVTAKVTSVGTGGLAALSTIDVSTLGGAQTALTDIEALIQTAIDAAAAFGSAQSRVDIQSEFVTKLTDSLKTGIGALVDANMEEASARLQALQVQQQLGIQSLSIANQAPQNVLALFR
jgi:flagellin